MVKGRTYAPPTMRKNHWFYDYAHDWTKELDKPMSKSLAPLTPAGFQAKEKQMDRGEFPFSKHDNHNAFQGHGIYFGTGYGKRMLPENKHHRSGSQVLPSITSKMPSSCYTSSYRLRTSSGGPDEEYRRYPHSHTAKSYNAERFNTCTERLSSIDSPYKTPLHILAITQEPFLRANTWVHAYKPKEYNKLLGP